MKSKNKIKFRIKHILLIALLLVVVLCICQCNTIMYGIKQAVGQLKIINNAVAIEEVLNDSLFPDSLKQKLLLVEEIKRFAVDSLGLNESKNYTTFYDQKGKPILWVVIASPPYELKAYTWKFPIVGEFQYLGFFNEKDAIKEKNKIQNEGYDARYGIVQAWSTLGYLKDPILSNMLYRLDGKLARLIIHELTHATLFIKNNVQFNENLATFVGDEGAKMFLKSYYGVESKQYTDYIGEINDIEKYSSHIFRGIKHLDSLYKSFSPELNIQTKDSLKDNMISEILSATDTLSLYNHEAYSFLKKKDFIADNTYFISYITYRDNLNSFREEFKTKFGSDFKKYLEFLKTKYSTL